MWELIHVVSIVALVIGSFRLFGYSGRLFRAKENHGRGIRLIRRLTGVGTVLLGVLFWGWIFMALMLCLERPSVPYTPELEPRLHNPALLSPPTQRFVMDSMGQMQVITHDPWAAHEEAEKWRRELKESLQRSVDYRLTVGMINAGSVGLFALLVAYLPGTVSWFIKRRRGRYDGDNEGQERSA